MSTSANRRLWLLEPELQNEHGHNYPWGLAIVGAARRRGWDVTVLAARRVVPSVREHFAGLGYELVPFFDPFPIDSPKIIKQGIGGNNYRRAIAHLRRHAGPNDIALTFSGQLEYGAVAAVECKRRELPCPLVVQFFTWDHFVPNTRATRLVHAGFLRSCRAALRHARSDTFRIAGQTQAIADAIGAKVGREVGCMPFPLDWSLLGDETNRPDRAPVVGYLGSARRDKGFEAFVDAVSRAEPTPALVAQTFRLPNDVDPEHPGREALLRSLGARVIDHGLHGQEFADAFAAVDILVLPYRRIEYKERNSSLLAEALGLGKVVIAPTGTWLGDTLTGEGVGVTYDPTDPDGLVHAVEHAVRDHDTLRDAAAAAAPAWRRRNAPDGFLDALLEVAG